MRIQASVSDEPFFPPPAQREPYRAPSPIAIDKPTSKPTIVTRPEPQSDSEAPRKLGPSPYTNLASEERSYWDRYAFFTRFPRVVGALMIALGAASTYSNVHTLLYGGLYSRRGAFAGPLLLASGIWPLVFGFPREGKQPPPWWTFGYVACVLVGTAIGGYLAFSLEAARID
jgi:hypothetical protein